MLGDVPKLKRTSGPIVVDVPLRWWLGSQKIIEGSPSTSWRVHDPEMIEWFSDNEITEYGVSSREDKIRGGFMTKLFFYFYHEEHAVLFKTTWL